MSKEGPWYLPARALNGNLPQLAAALTKQLPHIITHSYDLELREEREIALQRLKQVGGHVPFLDSQA